MISFGEQNRKKNMGIAAILVLVALLSVFVVSPMASKQETYKGAIQTLDKKKATILEMTTAATTASVALGAIPGDATTPIAEKIMDMAGYCIIMLAVILMEKYLLTIAGYLTFTWLIPMACLVSIIGIFQSSRVLRRLAVKLFALGLFLVLIVPVNVKLTQIIEKNNEESINTTLDNVKEIGKEAEATTEGQEGSGGPDSESLEKEGSSPVDYLGKVKSQVDDMMESARKSIKDAQDAVTQLPETTIEKAKRTVNDFVELVVVMLVTTCGIPIFTLILMFLIIRLILKTSFQVSADKKERKQSI